jgi:hypothetical protein
VQSTILTFREQYRLGLNVHSPAIDTDYELSDSGILFKNFRIRAYRYKIRAPNIILFICLFTIHIKHTAI